MTRLALTLLLLLPAAGASAQGVDLGDPEIPVTERGPRFENDREAELEAERARRRRIHREHLREALGPLVRMGRARLQQDLETYGVQQALSATLVGLGAAAFIGGFVAIFADMSCRPSSGYIAIGPSCTNNNPWIVEAGLITAGIGAVTVIANVIWLGVTSGRRARVRRAMRPNPYGFDLHLDHNGGRASVAMTF